MSISNTITTIDSSLQLFHCFENVWMSFCQTETGEKQRKTGIWWEIKYRDEKEMSICIIIITIDSPLQLFHCFENVWMSFLSNRDRGKRQKDTDMVVYIRVYPGQVRVFTTTTFGKFFLQMVGKITTVKLRGKVYLINFCYFSVGWNFLHHLLEEWTKLGCSKNPDLSRIRPI